MNLKKCIKRISATLLAATIIVSGVPIQPKVNAEEYPAEILFPVQILDFRADNMLFEYNSSLSTSNLEGSGSGGFGSLGGSLKGIVENNLESDPTSIYYGLPVYKEARVGNVANLTKKMVEGKYDGYSEWYKVINQWHIGNKINHISAKHYIRKNEWVVLDAEDTGKYKTDYQNSRYGGIRHYTELGGSATVTAGNDCLQRYYVSGIGGTGNGTVTFKYDNIYNERWNYKIKFFGMTNKSDAAFSVKVNGVEYTLNYANTGSNVTPLKDDRTGDTLTGIHLVHGENTIVISGVSGKSTPNLDRIEVSGQDGGTYSVPLGTYAESKAKYNIDRINNSTGAEEPDGIADYGWYDMETCYDYAYFVTANLYKYHPSLNSLYSDYNHLIFHRSADVSGLPTYEFAGDKGHTGADYGLIYNPTDKSIRNGNNSQTNSAIGEFRTTPGQMFVVDRVTKEFPNPDGYRLYSGADQYDTTHYHNYHYTIRTHSRFVYKKGRHQKFYFNGDDDVYVFVNGQLAMDIGGAHEQEEGEVDLDALNASGKLTLPDGQPVDFDFFYMERHTTQSNFYARMNFELANDLVGLEWPDDIKTLEELAIPYGYVVDLDYRFESNRELTTNANLSFSDQFGNKIGSEGFYLADGIRLRDDKKLTVTIKRGSGGAPVVKVFDFADNKTFTTAESDMVADYFKSLQFEQGDSLIIDGIIYDTALYKFDTYTETSDPKIRKMSFETYADYDMYMTMGGINSIEEIAPIHNKVTKTETVNVLVDKLTVSVKTDFGDDIDYRKDVSQFGKFTITRPETEDDSATVEDERIFYTNTIDISKGKNTLLFDPDVPSPIPENSPIEYIPTGIPRGRYKLNMDLTVLSGYDLSVEIKVKKPDGSLVDVEVKQRDDPSTPEDESTKIVDGETYTFNTLYLDVEPKIINKKWVYPEVEYILKAVRKINPLKDLT